MNVFRELRLERNIAQLRQQLKEAERQQLKEAERQRDELLAVVEQVNRYAKDTVPSGYLVRITDAAIATARRPE